jgi:hypothetical protein
MCRTEVCGKHTCICTKCNNLMEPHNSCRNRSCLICQGGSAGSICNPVPDLYYHFVFTLPHELYNLFMANKATMRDTLFDSAKKTLLDLCKEKLGGQISTTAVLHTWSETLLFHLRLRYIIPRGGTMRAPRVEAKPFRPYMRSHHPPCIRQFKLKSKAPSKRSV